MSGLYADRPPWFTTNFLPEAERATADHINLLLHVLEIHRDGFGAALGLFDHVNTLFYNAMPQPDRPDDPHFHQYGQWSFLAARSAVMEVYHFAITLDSVRGQIGLCKSLMPLVKTEQLKEAKRTFVKHFPRAERMRHAVGHIAGMMSNPELMNFNFQHMDNRTFQIGHKGERLSLEISEKNLNVLTAVMANVFNALREAAAATFPARQAPGPLPDADQTVRR
jgi:hypothetical protein